VTTPFIEPRIEPDRWEPPTMKSELQIEGNPLVQCGCGRTVNADMMRVFGDGYSCDACHETMFRTGQLTREEFALSHGAPSHVIDKARQIDAGIAGLSGASQPAADR
jgi:hypothetical protein